MEADKFRVGNGFDVHPFSDGGRLVLGGIEIPFEKGLSGHSDADVLLHAITDAVLGACAWGDIGSWFPDDDPQHKGADSKKFLHQVWVRAVDQGWSLGNCDSVVLAEAPKLRPHVDQIRESIAGVFSVDLSRISVKATTTEQLGFVGRGEGIAAMATVLLVRS